MCVWLRQRNMSEMRWQGWKTASLRRASQRQTKQGCSHWAGAERKMTECRRAEAKGTVTHTSAAGAPQTWTGPSLSWALPSKAAQRSSESMERLQGQRTHLHGWLDGSFMLLMGGLPLILARPCKLKKYMWYLVLSSVLQPPLRGN